MDDGIVIAENIYAHFERGKSPLRAALDGTTEVMNAVFTSVLTTVFAFSTLLFVGGEMEMMQEMAFSVIACLLFSLIEAFLILPSHLASDKILKSKEKRKSSVRAVLEKAVVSVREAYGRLLERILKRHRLHVWGPMVFILLVIGLFSAGWIRWTFFPSIPFDSILVELSYQPGERETRTEKFLWYCDSIAEEYNNELIQKYNDTIITYRAISVGSTENLGEVGSHVGSLRLSVKENEHISTIEMSNELKSKIPRDSTRFMQKFSVGGQQRFGRAVSLSLQSDDGEELQQAANWMKDQLKTFPEVKDVLDNSGIGNRELHLDLKSKAYLLGLNEMTISNQIRQGFFGQEVQRLIKGRDEIKIWLRYPLNDRNSISDIENTRIKTAAGEEFPLSELADYTIKRGKAVSYTHLTLPTKQMV